MVNSKINFANFLRKCLIAKMILILCVFVLSCASDDSDDVVKPTFLLDEPDEISIENYKIYSLVIDEMFDWEEIIVEQKSITDIELITQNNFYDAIVKDAPNFDVDLITNLVNVNQSPVKFGNFFISDNKQIGLISEEELTYYFKDKEINKGWKGYYNDYQKSNGIIKFTSIAFNESRTQSVLEVAHYYGSIAAEGSIVYLQKDNGVWSIIKVLPTWIS